MFLTTAKRDRKLENYQNMREIPAPYAWTWTWSAIFQLQLLENERVSTVLKLAPHLVTCTLMHPFPKRLRQGLRQAWGCIPPVIAKYIQGHEGFVVRSQASSLQSLFARHAVVKFTVKLVSCSCHLTPVRCPPQRTGIRIFPLSINDTCFVQLQNQPSHEAVWSIGRPQYE